MVGSDWKQQEIDIKWIKRTQQKLGIFVGNTFILLIEILCFMDIYHILDIGTCLFVVLDGMYDNLGYMDLSIIIKMTNRRNSDNLCDLLNCFLFCYVCQFEMRMYCII